MSGKQKRAIRKIIAKIILISPLFFSGFIIHAKVYDNTDSGEDAEKNNFLKFV